MAMKNRMGRVVALTLAVALPAGLAAAQSPTSPVPDEIRRAPPEIDLTRPGGDPAAPQPDRTGAGPTGNDIAGEGGGGMVRRGAEPGTTINPVMPGTLPDPTPDAPESPPAGTPGGGRSVIPR